MAMAIINNVQCVQGVHINLQLIFIINSSINSKFSINN